MKTRLIYAVITVLLAAVAAYRYEYATPAAEETPGHIAGSVTGGTVGNR